MYNEWIFLYEEKLIFCSQGIWFFLFWVDSKILKSAASSQALLHIKSYFFDCFFRILGSTSVHFTSFVEEVRAYSRPLLGVTIVPNLVPWVLNEVFSSEMVKNDICLEGASK